MPAADVHRRISGRCRYSEEMGMIVAVVVCLALVGLAISTYFTVVALGWMDPEAAWVPRVCRLDEQTCASVVHTPRARVFGIPNSVLGQAWYLALIVAAATGLLGSWPWHGLLLAASSGTVLLGVYLTWSLLFITRVHCRLCYTSHGLNGVLFLILLLSR